MRPGLSDGTSAGQQRLERFGAALAADDELAHVADVEQPGVGAGPFVLGKDAFDTAAASRSRRSGTIRAPCARCQASSGRVLGASRFGLFAHLLPDTMATPGCGPCSPSPPLSGNLRAWRTSARVHLRWPPAQEALSRVPALPTPRSFGLRDSGAVAPSAAQLALDALPRLGRGGPRRAQSFRAKRLVGQLLWVVPVLVRPRNQVLVDRLGLVLASARRRSWPCRSRRACRRARWRGNRRGSAATCGASP